MFEYIVTIFKVVAGVITNERLVIASLIATALLLLWIVFSLCFSFEMRFLSGAKKINQYISRNGIAGEHKQGLDNLVTKMPSEFVRGYHTYEKNPHSLPSEFIKRSDCLDLELNGGVFNQNRSIIKSYINTVFFALLIFSFAIMSNSSLFESGAGTSETALTGYMVAEALVLPFLFLLVAKIMYYIYTAIRQHQYHVAVEEFNEMMDNFDKEAIDTYGYIPNSLTVMSHSLKNKVAEKETKTPEVNVSPVVPVEENTQPVVQEVLKEDQGSERVQSEEVADKPVDETFNQQEEFEESASEYDNVPEQVLEVEPDIEEVSEPEETTFSEESAEPEEKSVFKESISDETENQTDKEVDLIEKDLEEDNQKFNGAQTEEVEELAKTQNTDSFNEFAKRFESLNQIKPEQNHEKEQENMSENQEFQDNFKPDFASLLGEDVQKKRGRGRPRKEATGEEGFVIKTDKDFEDALVRAEKLMRKNEEPLSASQTKRIEKQLKELIDAMSKYKENK